MVSAAGRPGLRLPLTSGAADTTLTCARTRELTSALVRALKVD
jgi:hypothetical protein